MDWHDIIFVVRNPASKMSETKTPRIFDIREVPVPGHALGHILHLNLKEITAYSTRCHDSADWSEVVKVLVEEYGDRLVYFQIGV
jgi:hypothetical protein